MDLLDRFLGHDEWTTRHLLMRCREVSEEGLRRRFDVGHGTLHETLVHLVNNVEAWTDLLTERPDRQHLGQPPSVVSVDRLIERFDVAYAAFAALARQVRDEGRWDDTYVDPFEDSPKARSIGGTIVHVITHDMSHRADILHMLQRLGVPDLIEGDALSWENRHRFTG